MDDVFKAMDNLKNLLEKSGMKIELCNVCDNKMFTVDETGSCELCRGESEKAVEN